MLYGRTGDVKFLALGEQIHHSMEANDRLKLASSMLAGVDVSVPGDGKAYQLMAVLLGYGELYRHTGRPRFLEAMTKAWETIRSPRGTSCQTEYPVLASRSMTPTGPAAPVP